MRLLQLTDEGFVLSEHYYDIPPYAILSHTWGPDFEEVTLADIVRGTGKEKPGYAKLHFCAMQAAYDHLSYFWIDFCCIDKSSSSELSEAINSMFKYYANSAKCYVYLADVSNNSDGSFKSSRWHTRGWTCQELVAPKIVEFYDRHGKLIGDRISLLSDLVQVSGIPSNILQGCPINVYNVEERLKWAEGRQTKKPEDAAYCLLGMCDVQIPLIYGEGREKAFYRLRREIGLEPGHTMAPTISAEKTPNDLFFRLLRNNWSRVQGKPQPIALEEASPEETWHHNERQIRCLAFFLRISSTILLLIPSLISLSFIESHSPLAGAAIFISFGIYLVGVLKIYHPHMKQAGVAWALLLVVFMLNGVRMAAKHDVMWEHEKARHQEWVHRHGLDDPVFDRLREEAERLLNS